MCVTAALVAVVLAPPAWSGAITFSQRLTPPTHALAESGWGERGAGRHRAPRNPLAGSCGFGASKSASRRTAGGPQRRAVSPPRARLDRRPGTVFREPCLRRLSFVRRFHSDQPSFFGNLGYDFEVYAAPKVPPSIDGADVRLDSPEAAPFLGPEWNPTPPRRAWRCPRAGASLFLPVSCGRRSTSSWKSPGRTVPPRSADLARRGRNPRCSGRRSRRGSPGTATARGRRSIDPLARGTELRLQPVQRTTGSVSSGCASADGRPVTPRERDDESRAQPGLRFSRFRRLRNKVGRRRQLPTDQPGPTRRRGSC